MTEKDKEPINLGYVFGKLWRHKLAYFLILPLVAVAAYFTVRQVPRYYVSNISLAPESSSGASSSLSSIASSFGLGSLSKMSGSDDAINAEMYPDLFSSNDFLLTLMSVTVKKQDKSYEGTYYEYLETCTKSAPWDEWIAKLKRKIEDKPVDTRKSQPSKLDIFNLTEKQNGIFEGVKGNINCNVDKKTGVVSISVKDQDPLVAATIANECSEKLQSFIMDYRTKKARIDYDYYKTLCDEAHDEYEVERKKYAAMSDADLDVMLPSVSQEQEEQENVMQLAYNKYTTLYTQFQMAQAKLQEATPVITMIQSASVAVKPAGPKRMLISLAVTFMFAIVMTFYIILKKEKVKDEKTKIKGKIEEVTDEVIAEVAEEVEGTSPQHLSTSQS